MIGDPWRLILPTISQNHNHYKFPLNYLKYILISEYFLINGKIHHGTKQSRLIIINFEPIVFRFAKKKKNNEQLLNVIL